MWVRCFCPKILSCLLCSETPYLQLQSSNLHQWSSEVSKCCLCGAPTVCLWAEMLSVGGNVFFFKCMFFCFSSSPSPKSDIYLCIFPSCRMCGTILLLQFSCVGLPNPQLVQTGVIPLKLIKCVDSKTSRESDFISQQTMMHMNFWNNLLQLFWRCTEIFLESLQRFLLRFSVGHSWLLSLKYCLFFFLLLSPGISVIS